MFFWNGIQLFTSVKELYDNCLTSEIGKTIFPYAVYSEDGELVGYQKYYID